MEGYFVVVGAGKDFGRVWQIEFKTTTCREVNIQLPCGTKGVSHGEACTWFEGAQIFLQYQHVTRGNSHLLTMLEFYYNIKKWR
jgi:hypothetical protein